MLFLVSAAPAAIEWDNSFGTKSYLKQTKVMLPKQCVSNVRFQSAQAQRNCLISGNGIDDDCWVMAICGRRLCFYSYFCRSSYDSDSRHRPRAFDGHIACRPLHYIYACFRITKELKRNENATEFNWISVQTSVLSLNLFIGRSTNKYNMSDGKMSSIFVSFFYSHLLIFILSAVSQALAFCLYMSQHTHTWTPRINCEMKNVTFTLVNIYLVIAYSSCLKLLKCARLNAVVKHIVYFLSNVKNVRLERLCVGDNMCACHSTLHINVMGHAAEKRWKMGKRLMVPKQRNLRMGIGWHCCYW